MSETTLHASPCSTAANGRPLDELLSSALGEGDWVLRARGIRVSDLCHDSRAVRPGALFIAAPGAVVHGARFVADAVARGAVAILTDGNAAVEADVPVIAVPDARAAISRAMAGFLGLAGIQARRELACIGITGTNGKTTTACMIRAILRACSRPTALLGTIEYDLIGRRVPAPLTTPDPIDLVRYLVEAHAAGATHAVMEVSSHSLDQARTSGIRFSAGVFTNLTQDHLDYHGTMDDYRRAKQRLFDSLESDAFAIVNADDAAAVAMVSQCRASVARYGLKKAPGVGFLAEILEESRSGTRFRLHHADGEADVFTPMVGRHNVSNALAALATCTSLGCSFDTVAPALAAVSHVPGRLQRIDTAGLGFDIYIDYAHTDDALRNVLSALRPTTSGRLWCVFGCGGDRDRTKRPRMARAVADGADAFVITSDNPRTEDPLAIIRDIEAGLTADDSRKARQEPDRARAIHTAVDQLAAGDTLLIAGKGHEDYQILGTTKVHFDDAEVARSAVDRRLHG